MCRYMERETGTVCVLVCYLQVLVNGVVLLYLVERNAMERQRTCDVLFEKVAEKQIFQVVSDRPP